jgi:hypothetical protein
MDWLTGIGTAIGGMFGYKGQKDTNVASAQQAQKQMDFQRQMSNTAVQRRMADLKKAGINPILAGSKEASSPAGQQAPVGNKAQSAMNSAMNSAQLNKVIQEGRIMKNTADLTDVPNQGLKTILDNIDTFANNVGSSAAKVESAIRNLVDGTTYRASMTDQKKKIKMTIQDIPKTSKHHPQNMWKKNNRYKIYDPITKTYKNVGKSGTYYDI